MHEFVIVGGGPAGLAAAIFAMSKHVDVKVIYEQFGGWTGSHQRLVGQLGNEPLAGEEAIEVFERQVAGANVAIQDRVLRVSKDGDTFKLETRHHGIVEAAAVLIATGTTPIRLDVPGAQEFRGYGLGYSATTHAHLLRGKVAAVVGNTDRAMRGTIELSQVADKVYLIGDLEESDSSLVDTVVQLPAVEVLEGWEVSEIAGGFNVEEVVVRRGTQQRRLAVDAAFVDLGLHANSDLVRGFAQTDLDGFIMVDDRRETNVAGLYAAGDVTTMLGEQKLIAIGEGARAAWSAYGYVLAWRAARVAKLA
jgi:thioredoxin reductase (NADPH)